MKPLGFKRRQPSFPVFQILVFGDFHIRIIERLAHARGENSVGKLAEALDVSLAQIDKIQKFLLSAGILERHGNWVRPGKRMLHLNKSDFNIKKHHTIWRLLALQAIDLAQDDGSHYSACFSISKKDAETLNAMILSDLEKYLKLIESSKEEVGYVFNFDFYPLILSQS